MSTILPSNETTTPIPGSPLPSDHHPPHSGLLSPHSNQSGGHASLSHAVGLLDQSVRRSVRSVVDVREHNETANALLEELPSLPGIHLSQRGKGGNCEASYGAINTIEEGNQDPTGGSRSKPQPQSDSNKHASLVNQIPAIAVISLLNLMMAIPFGVSYFPIGWSNGGESSDGTEDKDGVSGSFPLPNKEALGIRMCLFSTLIGQIIMSFASKFDAAIAFQMIGKKNDQ